MVQEQMLFKIYHILSSDGQLVLLNIFGSGHYENYFCDQNYFEFGPLVQEE